MSDTPKNSTDKSDDEKTPARPNEGSVELTPEEQDKVKGGLDSVRRGGWDGN